MEGKADIVTGAGRSIRKGIALILAEAGADVALAARAEEQLENTAGEIRKLGRRVLTVPTNVLKNEQIENAVDKTISEFGKIDILVNNAGIPVLKLVAFISGMKLEGWQAAE